MPSIAGFIRTQLNDIENLQFQGYSLLEIYHQLQPLAPQNLNFNTFSVAIYRARKKRDANHHATLSVTHNQEITKDQEVNLTPSKKISTIHTSNPQNIVKQVRQIFKDGADVSEYL